MIFKYRNRAFSLIEVSAVILIIGILIAGVFAGTSIIKRARLQTAESLSKSSPIPGIASNALWLETSLENSISDSESNDGSLVTSWTDQKVAGNKSAIDIVGTGPTYANTINYVHAIRFADSLGTNHLKISDATFLNNTDYTIVVVEKRQSATAGYFLRTTDSSDVASNILALGYVSDGVVGHIQTTNYTVTPKVSSYAESTNKARVFVFIQDSNLGKKTYINGTLAAQDASTSQLSGVTTLAIGKGYTGEIGEIAIFTKALTVDDRKSVEDYLTKKWSRKNNRSSNASCLNGITTDTGCDNSCSVSVTGVSTPSSVVDGASGNLNCDSALGYSGTVAYTCSNGSLTPTGSCTATTCSITGVTGFNNKTDLAYATSATAISSPCQTDYTGSPTYTCTTTGAATISGSCTAITCSITSVTGFNNKTGLAYAASATAIPDPACATDYSGTPTYTCTTTGAATISGTCVSTVSPCTGGTIDSTTVSGKTVHVFTASGTFTCPSARNVEVLVVAGGGGGGGGASTAGGAGGGGGGLRYSSSLAVSTSGISVTVGAGGARGAGVTGTAGNGGTGQDSIFSSLTAAGGGGGGGRDTVGVSGGSGGGGGVSGSTRAGGAASTNPSGQGYAGGSNADNNYGAGGGGGAGAVGQTGASAKGGNGGVGLQYNLTGTSNYYAGGGGASYYNTTGTFGTGGSGGGGTPVVGTPTDSTANTGGGGAGAGRDGNSGGQGGSGIVIVRYNN
ncbi:MAG: prepilin-type N-terminal cleavage/methylation domain-containing protein [Pseudomonadota bacterium]